jgi:uncharacterized protein YegL
MSTRKTIIVSIIDRSGSMSGLEEKTISGFNEFIDSQRKLEGEVEINTILFDDQFEVLHNQLPLQHIDKMTHADYTTRGSTALLDAIGRSIYHIERRVALVKTEGLADKIIFFVITDGMENSSRQYSFETIRSLISRHTERDHWEFLFMGANMDAVKEAARYGIRSDRAMNYQATEEGVAHAYHAASAMMRDIRSDKVFSSRDYELPVEPKTKKNKA